MSPAAAKEDYFDAIVVGSGFGGSVMAYRLAESSDPKLEVCLLERGKAWPPGSFPRTPFEFSRAFWDPSEGLHGLFDLWYFGRLAALVSSGLGGGSLIYANVILEKPESWFVERGRDWPIKHRDLQPHYDAVGPMLAPVEYPERYRDEPKTKAFYQAATSEQLNPFYPPLAVTFGDPIHEPGRPFEKPEDNLHKKQRYTCRLVGECDAGCNFGSKNSLDFAFLSKASRLKIKCRHEVKQFERCKHGYRVEVADHDGAKEGEPRANPPALRVMYAKRLILSAGALGTPYLLLRNQIAFPNLSRRLGTCFSGNGDFIAFAARAGEPLDPSRGPVITASVKVPDVVDGGDGPGHYVQDGGYPDFIAWIGEMLELPRLAWAGKGVAARLAWETLSGRPDSNLSAEAARLVGTPSLAGGTLPLLGIGREPPQGRMKLGDNGLLEVEWSFAEATAYFDHVRCTLRKLTRGLDATFEDSVLWKLSTSITVHPLGGCPIGRTEQEGVVNPRNGEVHNYEGLHVADGSVMPGTVGTNPGFTIAAVADLFADAILDEWPRR